MPVGLSVRSVASAPAAVAPTAAVTAVYSVSDGPVVGDELAAHLRRADHLPVGR